MGAHPLLGCSFIFLESKRRREVELEKRQHLQKLGTHPKATSRHGFQGSRQQGNNSPYSTDLRGRTTFNVHRFRGEQQHEFLRVLAHIPRLSYSFSRHRNRGGCWARFSEVRKIRTVRTDLHRIRGPYCHKFWARFSRYLARFSSIALLGIFVQLQQKFGTQIEDSPYNIHCWDSRTVYGFLVQKSRSNLQDCTDKFV
jgi:hypothetical protein